MEEDDFGEEEYDALNDETFGSEATIGDWEKDHEKLAEITESSRSQHKNASDKKVIIITSYLLKLKHYIQKSIFLNFVRRMVSVSTSKIVYRI